MYNKNKLPYLISLIFCPPRPIMHPIKSFGIVISCVCTLCMFLGGPPTLAAAAAAEAAGFIGCCGCCGGCNCGGGGGGVWFVIIDAIHKLNRESYLVKLICFKRNLKKISTQI